VPEGTEILSGQDGIVTFAGNNGDYGLFVVIEGASAGNPHGSLISRYAHCSQILVTVGQEVKKGDAIARVGSTGVSSGAHLHLEVIVNGAFLNPIFFAESH
jgi:murein DD-endopeptidase MepM/ murein hydrolase activator NlpD